MPKILKSERLAIIFCLKMMADTIGARIAEIIKLRKVTQRQVASEMDVPPSTLNSYIQGKTYPNVEFLAIFCNTYNVNADFLLYGTGSADRDTQDLVKIFPTTSSEEILDLIETLVQELRKRQARRRD